MTWNKPTLSSRLETAITERPGMTAFDAGTAAGVAMPGSSGAAVHVVLRSLCSQGRLRRERSKDGMFRYYPAGAALFQKKDPVLQALANAKPRSGSIRRMRNEGFAEAARKCGKCKRPKPVSEFRDKKGKEFKLCNPCRKLARDRTHDRGRTVSERLAARSVRRDKRPTGRVRFVFSSTNRKTGPIPVSTSERGTCPPSCAFYTAGCYADYGRLGSHWRGTETRGLSWEAFVRRIAMLVPGQIWRHNVAGDLPGEGEAIDAHMLSQLVRANHGKRGFTFTHKHQGSKNREAIKKANAQGFSVNLSADSLEEADLLAKAGVGPVVVVLPENAPDKLATPGGNSIAVCPAETSNNAIQCRDCGLCAKSWRKIIIGFRAHGPDKALVSQLVRQKRAEEEAQAS